MHHGIQNGDYVSLLIPFRRDLCFDKSIHLLALLFFCWHIFSSSFVMVSRLLKFCSLVQQFIISYLEGSFSLSIVHPAYS